LLISSRNIELMDVVISLHSLTSAIGTGLLIGAVRERAQPDPQHSAAGIRTHVMVALAGALGAALGTGILVAVLLVVGALCVASYLRTAPADPGLTGEVALPVTALLAALAHSHPAMAAGLAVVVAGALFAKDPLHQLVRERITQQELRDGLLLAGAALVVLPLLPDKAVDPWGVLVPSWLWRMVVLIMAVGMLGQVALRSFGARWGLPLAGFLSGFASSTAAVAGFGHRARAEPEHVVPAAAGALFANLGSLALFAGVVAAAAPQLIAAVALPLAAAGAALLAVAGAGILRRASITSLPDAGGSQAFRLSHALLLACVMGVLLLVSAWLQRQFGSIGVLIASAAVALAELHAAAASISQLSSEATLPVSTASWGLVLLLLVSSIAKTVLAFVSGGANFGWRVGAGLLLVPAVAGLVLFLATIV
jgi:uncharacterized membrane protein (DUF4010 family)